MDEKDANRADQAAEELTKAARESYRAAVDRAFAARESNMRLSRSFFEDWIDTFEAQAELNRHVLKSMAEMAWEQRQNFLRLSRESSDAYDGFLGSLYTYYEEVSEEPKEPEKDG